MAFYGLISLLASLLVCSLVQQTASHGRLWAPPARNCMWRFGYPNPVNFNDNELWCGGYAVHHDQNGGKCGVCGDAYQMDPKPHEPGGDYANGIISKRYVPGQVVEMEVDVTVSHLGIFEMSLCENNDPKKVVTQECFDKHPLKIIDSQGRMLDNFTLPVEPTSGIFTYKVKLPTAVTCTNCILQWKWTTGNTWGTCPDGTEKVGCGPQETFINCADVAINPISGSYHPPKNRDNPFQIYYKDYSKQGNPLVPLVVRSQVCVGTGTYASVPGIDEWCQSNCLKYPPSCPSDKCRCLQSCEAIGMFKENQGSDEYCREKCLVYPPKCPSDKCVCY